MSMYWIYNLSNLILAILIITTFIVLGVYGLLKSRPLVGRLLNPAGAHNDIVSYVFSAVGVFYGLTLGLIAVATWQNFTAADAVVSQEAALIDNLYNTVKGYPLAVRLDLDKKLRTYTNEIVEVEWPAHRQGGDVPPNSKSFETLETAIMSFEPHCDREKLNHNATIQALGKVMNQRQMRLQAANTGLPAVLWWVVILGAMLTILITTLFWIQNATLHAILMGAQAMTLGLLIFLVAAMDNPFRGEFSVTPDLFQRVLCKTMDH